MSRHIWYWEDIKSAPKDGTVVNLLLPSGECGYGKWASSCWGLTSNMRYGTIALNAQNQPTHWRKPSSQKVKELKQFAAIRGTYPSFGPQLGPNNN